MRPNLPSPEDVMKFIQVYYKDPEMNWSFESTTPHNEVILLTFPDDSKVRFTNQKVSLISRRGEEVWHSTSDDYTIAIGTRVRNFLVSKAEQDRLNKARPTVEKMLSYLENMLNKQPAPEHDPDDPEYTFKKG